MFDSIMKFFNKMKKKEEKVASNSKEAAKERLHLVLMQDRANVSADFLELMKQEIIEVIKKYIEIDEGAIDVRLTNKENEDGTNGAPALYANIPILNIKNEARKVEAKKEVQSKEEANDKGKNDVKEEESNQEKDSSEKLEDEDNQEKEEKDQKDENNENVEEQQEEKTEEEEKEDEKEEELNQKK